MSAHNIFDKPTERVGRAGFKDLRGYLTLLEEAGELLEISVPVSTHLEITEIADRISKSPVHQNKALLFTNVTGLHGESYDMPVLINAMGSHRRMMLALGVDDYTEIQKRIEDFIHPKVPGNF